MNDWSFLILAAMGLAVIFGMMKVINLAHGEFIMIGAYLMTFCVNSLGLPFLMALIIAVVGTGLVGVIVDRLLISHLYGRTLDSVVVTWGLSMIIKQGFLVLFGPSLNGFPMPLNTIEVFGSKMSEYMIVLFVVSILLIIAMWILFHHTAFGLNARATIENANIAESLGIDTRGIYATTFGLGSGLAGLCGALYAPVISLTPNFGQSFLMQSFVTVIAGGAEPLIGTALGGSALGLLQSVLDVRVSSFFGLIGLLLAAIVIIRVLPGGFSSLAEKWSISRQIRKESAK